MHSGRLARHRTVNAFYVGSNPTCAAMTKTNPKTWSPDDFDSYSSEELEKLSNKKILSKKDFEQWASKPHRGRPTNNDTLNLLSILFTKLDAGDCSVDIDVRKPPFEAFTLDEFYQGPIGQAYAFFQKRVRDYWLSREKLTEHIVRLRIVPGPAMAHGHRKAPGTW